jgi:hypothetical protein
MLAAQLLLLVKVMQADQHLTHPQAALAVVVPVLLVLLAVYQELTL